VRQLLMKLSELAEAGPADRAKQAFAWKEFLFKLPSDELASGVCINPSLWNRFATITLKKMVYCLLKIFWRLRVYGRENLPRKGPYILCPNHASFLDPFILLAGLPDCVMKSTYFQGYSGIFKRRFFRSITRFARIVQIDSNANLAQALQMSSFILIIGRFNCILPEGTRSIDENIQPFKKGVAILARELNVPVVPVLIKGSGKAWPRAVRLPRLHPVKVIYGKPLTMDSLLQCQDDASRQNYQKIADAPREKVAALGDA
jgi:long-chain acyl-CoA synthetase